MEVGCRQFPAALTAGMVWYKLYSRLGGP